MCWLSFGLLGGQEADQEGDHILSQGVDDDPKVQDGEDLIPEREVEGQEAHLKPGTVDHWHWGWRQSLGFPRLKYTATYWQRGGERR